MYYHLLNNKLVNSYVTRHQFICSAGKNAKSYLKANWIFFVYHINNMPTIYRQVLQHDILSVPNIIAFKVNN